MPPAIAAVLASVLIASTFLAPAALPLSRIREMALVVPKSPVAARGVVTRYRPGQMISIEDQTCSLFVYADRHSEHLVPGDVIDVSGRADLDDDGAPCIAGAIYRKVGTAPPPKPITVAAADLLSGRHEAALVSVEGRLLRVEPVRNEYGLVVDADGVQFPGWVYRDVADHAPAIRPGSRIRVTGIASRPVGGDGRRGLQLFMRSGADASVLLAAPWWTSQRISVAVVALGGSSVLLFSYVVMLRRQVRRQTAIIAERLKVEADLKEQYRQAQKMEAVGRLAGGIAHDFNNVMTVVLGHSDVLASELRGQPHLLESVDEIRRAGERAAAVTRQLLAFGRRQRLEAAPVELNDVVRAMALLLKRVLGGEIEIVTEPSPNPVTIVADRAQLEQALLNLAVNARDAMPDGGRLTLSVATRQDAAKGTVAVLAVRDTGSGIPADAQPHIFDPFFTTKDVGQGSGLGLAMVYGFVRQSGGTITFDTAEGKGTTFELIFPVA